MYTYKVVIEFFDGTSMEARIDDVMNEAEAVRSVFETHEISPEDIANYEVIMIES